MKWSTTKVPQFRKPNGAVNVRAEVCAAVEKEIMKDGAVVAVDTVLRCAERRGRFYLAVLRRDMETMKVESVRALVARSSMECGRVRIEFEPEGEPPAIADCPDVVLDLLTEPGNERASRWRKQCRERNAERRRQGGCPHVMRVKEKDIEDDVVYECPVDPEIADTYGFKPGELGHVRRKRCKGGCRRVVWELEARSPWQCWVSVPARYIDKSRLAKAAVLA